MKKKYGVIAQKVETFMEAMFKAEDGGYSFDYDYALESENPAEIIAFLSDKDLAGYTIEIWNINDNGAFYTGSDFDEPENFIKNHQEHEIKKVSSIFDANNTGIRKIDGFWYSFGYCEYSDTRPPQVFAIGADAPNSGKAIANFCDAGIKDIATPQKTRKAAAEKAKRYNSLYGGEFLGEM